MTPSERRLGYSTISQVTTLLVFFSLWILDFPKPCYDDLFYTGAALNMTAGGDFSNPLLARQGFPNHYFFVYPPLHSYVLAAWLKVFGVSSGSMTGFAILMIAVTSLATIKLLRRHAGNIWLELVVPFGATFTLFELGLRPDTFAVALTMAGFALADWKLEPGASFAFGFLLMFLGASAAPRITFFALALAGCVGYRSWRRAGTSQEKCKMLVIVGCAALLTALAFLCLIHFRLAEFLNTFQFHSTRFAGMKKPPLHRFVLFLIHEVRILHWPFVLMPLGLLIFHRRKPKDGLSLSGIYTLMAFPVVAAAGLVGTGAMWWLVLSMLLLGAAAVKILSARWRTALTAAIVTVLLMANRREFIAVSGILSGEISSDLGEERAAALAIQPSPEHALLVDSWLARYLYDYHLPEGTLDLGFGAPFPGTLPGIYPLPPEKGPEFRPGDVYLASSAVATLLVHYTCVERAIPKWIPFGLSQFTVDRNPRHVYIIPSDSCKERRKSSI